jgi:hypothetical protein
MGKGVWIWKLSACEGGSVAAIIAKAQRAGLTRVAVKIADGLSAYNPTPALHTLADGLRAVGIDCWGWGWSYGGGLDRARAEADLAGHRVLGLGLTGYVIDAEAQYETGNSAATARAYCVRLREIIGQVPLGVTSYWSPALHPQVPWKAFAALIDYWWPQVYWYTRNPRQTLQQCLAELEPYGREVIPLGAADPGDGCNSATELAQFCAGVNARPDLRHGADFYSWQDVPGANWTVIKQTQFG